VAIIKSKKQIKQALIGLQSGLAFLLLEKSHDGNCLFLMSVSGQTLGEVHDSAVYSFREFMMSNPSEDGLLPNSSQTFRVTKV
jgi:hypothetical protein